LSEALQKSDRIVCNDNHMRILFTGTFNGEQEDRRADTLGSVRLSRSGIAYGEFCSVSILVSEMVRLQARLYGLVYIGIYRLTSAHFMEETLLWISTGFCTGSCVEWVVG
jgi:hypothetical protein